MNSIWLALNSKEEGVRFPRMGDMDGFELPYKCWVGIKLGSSAGEDLVGGYGG